MDFEKIFRFIKEDDGLETIEYAVMTALIVATLVAAVAGLAGAISAQFNATANTIN